MQGPLIMDEIDAAAIGRARSVTNLPYTAPALTLAAV